MKFFCLCMSPAEVPSAPCPKVSRQAFVISLSAVVAFATITSSAETLYNGIVMHDERPPQHILVRDFRTVKDGEVVCFNIGTAAHGPATLAVLQKHLPDVRLSVWADAPLSPELRRLMARRFPDVTIHTGLDVPKTDADLFLVSSGSTIAQSVQRSIEAWRKQTGRPVAAYAIGYNHGIAPLTRTMSFCYFRDKTALDKARSEKAVPPVTGFAPDAVFDFDAVDEAGAAAFLKDHSLEPGKFVCAIPGERFTANWTYFNRKPNLDRAAVNARHELTDNALVCAAIIEAVRRFGLKVLLCAEQRSEMPLIERALLAQLPEDVKGSCIALKEFWAPDVALGVYRQSRCVFGIEMHSQVMAIGSGVPAIVMRHSGFGSKSDMLKDIGLPEWTIDIDEPGATAKVVAIVGGILADEKSAREKVKAARATIDKSAREALSHLLPRK